MQKCTINKNKKINAFFLVKIITLNYKFVSKMFSQRFYTIGKVATEMSTQSVIVFIYYSEKEPVEIILTGYFL